MRLHAMLHDVLSVELGPVEMGAGTHWRSLTVRTREGEVTLTLFPANGEGLEVRVKGEVSEMRRAEEKT